MDTVDLVLITLVLLLLSTVALAALAWREHVRAEAAQREVARLNKQYLASYDTGLKELA